MLAWSPLPQQKPQFPPCLTMPSGMTFDSEPTAVPKINTPDGDHDIGGPSFNIVPATPVTGGDATGRQHIPFQRTRSHLFPVFSSAENICNEALKRFVKIPMDVTARPAIMLTHNIPGPLHLSI